MNEKLQQILEQMRALKWQSGIKMIEYMESKGLTDKEMIVIATQMLHDDKVRQLVSAVDDLEES